MEVDGGGGGGVPSLPEDIIFAVLSWLPAKPLCRFRCVCKAWRALISSAAFTAAQRSRAAPLLVGAFAAAPPPHAPEGPFCPPVFDVPMAPDDELRVMDADGTVLRVLSGALRCYDRLLPTRLDLVCVDRWSGGGAGAASVFDPATRRVVTVGRQAHGGGGGTHRFGRAAPSGAYKIIRLHDEFVAQEIVRDQRCEIATLPGEDGGAEPEPAVTWRRRPESPFVTCWCASCTVTVHGVVYFLPRGACGYLHSNRVASFDLESEEWKKMIHGPELRHPKSWERWSNALGEIKGALCWVETVLSCQYGSYTIADVWVLVDSERSIWVKEYTIRSPDSLFIVKPLEVLRHGRLLLLKTIEEAEGEPHTRILQLYDPSTGDFTDLKMMPKEFRGMVTLYTGNILSQL